MEKSYLAMDDGEKAAAEAENAMMLARVNFMVAMASALVPKDRNKINEQLVNSNWRMVWSRRNHTHAGKTFVRRPYPDNYLTFKLKGTSNFRNDSDARKLVTFAIDALPMQ